MDGYQLVIGGERVPAADGSTFTANEPGLGAPMAEVAKAGPEDARRAVDVARRRLDIAVLDSRPSSLSSHQLAA